MPELQVLPDRENYVIKKDLSSLVKTAQAQKLCVVGPYTQRRLFDKRILPIIKKVSNSQ